MKKLSFIILSMALVLTGLFVSACDNGNNGKIILSQESVTIYLGETENNSVTINAKLEDISVSSLRLYYDNSNIRIQSSAKKSDGSFDLKIVAISGISTSPIEVTVEAKKNVSAKFFVDISLPIVSIDVEENLYIPYEGEDVVYNLQDKLIFNPQETKQTSVVFDFAGVGPDGVEIVDGNLVISSSTYTYSEEPIELMVQSAEAGKSSIVKYFNVQVLQNVQSYQDEIIFISNFAGAEDEISSTSYELKIEDETLSTFEILIKIPTERKISVEIDSSSYDINNANIMNILDVSTYTYVDGDYTVFKFSFLSTKLLAGKGNLYFNFYYNEQKNDEKLVSKFVKVKTLDGYDIASHLEVNVVIPIKQIQVKTDCFTNGNNNYVIYKNYNNSTMEYGTEFSFGAVPANTTQKQLTVINLSNNIEIYRANGVLVAVGETITIGEKVYIKASASVGNEGLLGNTLKVSGSDETELTLIFDISTGATDFGFVNSMDSISAVGEMSLAVEYQNAEGSLFYLYAPNAGLADLEYDSTIFKFKKNGNYFEGIALGVEVGVKSHTILTKNGYSATLNLTTIAKLENVEISVKYNSTAGIGKLETIDDKLSMAIKYGYSVELEYFINDRANISKINYSFYDSLLGSEDWKDAYSNYDVIPENIDSFSVMSNIIDSQNIQNKNIITAKNEGKLVIKIEVVGQKVANGIIVDDVQEAKYVLVEVYKPAIFIQAEEKAITLRAENQVDMSEKEFADTTTKTIKVETKSSSTQNATYYQLFLDQAEYDATTNTSTFTYRSDLEVVLDHNTQNLTISAKQYNKVSIRFVVFAVDFENINSLVLEDLTFDYDEVLKNHTAIAYTFTVNMQNSEAISDIEVTNIKLAEEQNIENVKLYEPIYVDSSKLEATGANYIEIATEISPISAFDKRLKYSFVPDAGYSENIVDISSNDGIIRIPGNEGGTGYIQIEAVYSGSTAKVIRIPITVADGNSKQTAYRIASLEEITNLNKHYILTSPITYNLTNTLFSGNTFNGGLYGRIEAPDNMATIALADCPLFDSLGKDAVVEDLYIYGTSKATGFVANVNDGKILNVKVTTYIKNGVYIPSVLTSTSTSAVGGIVGTNKGSIENCTFAGSISATNCNVIAGTNEGTISNCKLYIAKFETTEGAVTLQETVTDGEGNNTQYDIYVNGNLKAANGEFATQDGVEVISYKDVEFDTNIYINTSQNAIGKEGSNYGILMFYLAEDSSLQEYIRNYNTVNYNTLFSSSNNYLKTKIIDHGTTRISNVITSNADSLTVNGLGLFDITVYSELDYTQSKIFNVYSIYYFDSLKFFNGNELIEDKLEIKSNTIREIKSSTETQMLVFENGVGHLIKLKANSFSLNFIFSYTDEHDANQEVDGSAYISGLTVGTHSINANWDWMQDTIITAKIVTNMQDEYNELINSKYIKEFNIVKVLGATRIDVNKSEETLEPKDTLTFSASITTDNSTDVIRGNDIDGVESTIIIYNSYDKDCTNAFNISVILNETTGAYEIQVSLKEAYKGMPEYVDMQYQIKVQAIDGSIADAKVYDCYNIVILNVLPQSISSINTTVYQVSGKITDGVIVSDLEPPTSVIKPTDQALLLIDLYPEYAYFDHIDITATSSDQTKLYFSPQKHKTAYGTDELLKDQYIYDKNGKFDSIPNANGIRLYNNYGNEEQIAGQYAILLHASSKLADETIFTINIDVYDKDGNKLDISKSFLLYVKMPASPEISINGESSVIAELGESLVADVAFATNQSFVDYYVINENGNKINDKLVLSRSEIVVSNGYKKCNIYLAIPNDYELTSSTDEITLVVKSSVVDRGTTITRESEVYINIVDFKLTEDCITIKDVVEGNYNVTSLKAQKLELNIFANLGDNVSESIQSFRDNYYFEGVNGYTVGSSSNLDSQGKILATYLSYVNGNKTYPIAKVIDDGILIFSQDSNTYKDYIKFKLNADGELYVQGGDFTGSVPMLLSIKYVLPDGTEYTYEYNFTIVNSLYTTEDLPVEIANANDLLAISEKEQAYDYILSRDIYLYDYEVIQNTSNIKSLDGNNYTIHIMNFKAQDSTTLNYSLFNTIDANTTIKNLTVNYYYLNTIDVANTVSNVNFAGFAITNNGIITNSEVVTYYNTGDKIPTFVTYGLKLNILETSNAVSTVAGFVITNNGSITNSRVGGDEKIITKFNSETLNVDTTKLSHKQFTIRACGNLAGFVFTNNGIISSSFAKNINIINTYNKQETMRTSGFVDTNAGQISLSYVEGTRQASEIQIENGGLEATGILSGFAYTNNASISDCYSNIMVKNLNNQIGRLGAGFVYLNAENGVISRSYSFSKVLDDSTTQANFAGITLDLQYNNYGKIENCYYYADGDQYVVTIENLYNTEINYVTNVGSVTNFYGFAFSHSTLNTTSTWTIDSATGPKLVSANNIARSYRYKVEVPANGDSNLPYRFVYADGYEYGTATNPVIIRSAEEFNNVLGNGNGSEYVNNFTSTKIYGAYRLVNNIDLLELVSGEDIASEYKYNLKSTQMILSGELTQSSNRTGSFDGNGLTINNLAISNNRVSTDNYGLFKSVENGASISNLNISVSRGGIGANNTMNVGVVAGTLKDASLTNVKISAQNGDSENTYVIGANLVGGAVGRVVGNSFVANVTVENISVTASYYQHENVVIGNKLTSNLYERGKNSEDELLKISKKSIAGGAFGVIDIDYSSLQSDISDVVDIRNANVQGVYVQGVMEIYGMTVGGVIGYTGESVVARNLSLTLAKSERQQKLIAYNCYAGGIVGYNKGYLYQLKAEHESSWQTEIENNINSYYVNEETRESIDRGNTSLFTLEGDYKPAIIGGLVGVLESGKLNIAYSKLNVINTNAKVAGGAVGYVQPLNSNTDITDEILTTISEVYAIGDVYATNASVANGTAYVGGLIGLNSNAKLEIAIANALNYYSYDTFKDVISVQSVKFDPMGNYTSQNIPSATNLAHLVGIQFNETEKSTFASNYKNNNSQTEVNVTTMKSYFDYPGITADDGAQIDKVFKQNSWYNDNNWTRNSNEMFPHIVYNQPVKVYELYSSKDFYKLSLYGSDPNSVFVVMIDDQIDCTNVTMEYSNFKATLRGLYENSGFKNIKRPLFSDTSKATFTNLKFTSCSSMFIEEAKNTFFKNIAFEDCTFSTVKEGNLAGIAGQIITTSGTNFEQISFTNCNLNTSNQVARAGLLFGSETSESDASGSAGAITNISGVTVVSSKVINLTKVENDSSIGVLFGSALNARVDTVSVSDSIDVQVLQEVEENNISTEANIGIIAGRADSLEISNFKINRTTKSGTSENGLNVSVAQYENKENSNTRTVSVGGVVGSVSHLIVKDSSASTIITSDIKVSGRAKQGQTHYYNDLYVGSIAGNVKTSIATTGAEGIIVDGYTSNQKTVYPKITIDTATDNTFVGGMFGLVNDASINNITYNGDLLLNTINTEVISVVNVGGIVGSVISGSITNANFIGTISSISDIKSNNSYYLGGIIGTVQYGNNVNLTSVISAGDILLDNGAKSINTNGLVYVAGVVGYNEGTTILDSANSITSIYSLRNASKIDIDNLFIDALVYDVGSVNATSSNYASNLALCVSKVQNVNNLYYTDFISTIEKTSSTLLEQVTLPEGTKLNPKSFDYNTMEETSEQFSILATTGNEIVYKSTGTRKFYMHLDSSIELNETNQISLQNAVVFSDGNIITTKVTPFNSIGETSFVSGVVSKIYTKYASNSYAGFANENSGVIYTSVAQEVLYNTSLSDLTQFYGVLHINGSTSKNVGGFVGTNSGYIFGSNSNVDIKPSKALKIGGFAGTNSGYIDYSYANGVIDSQSSTIDLFANNEGTILNSYTLVASTTTSAAVATGVCAEQEISETTNISETTGSIDSVSGAYYATNDDYNYGYPTISAGQFVGFTYLQRCTLVEHAETDINNSGLITTTSIYKEKINDSKEENLYSQIPNIGHLKNIQSGSISKVKNYVLIRNLNIGYAGESLSDTLIKGTLEHINLDGYKRVLNNIALNNCYLFNAIGTGTIIHNLEFGGAITLTSESKDGKTAIIGINEGTLEEVDIISDAINVDIKTDTDATYGILVEKNSGKILESHFNSKLNLTITASDTELSVSLGYIGENAGGTIELCKVKNNASVKGDGATSITYGSLVGKLSGGIISQSGLDGDIEVYSKKVVVGGIVGTASSGKVSQCYTLDEKSIIGGAEEATENNSILAEESHVGGIIGTCTSTANELIIIDCCNEADVTAAAKWQKVSGSDNKYKYFDYDHGNVVFLYNLLESKAYAGGIISNYLTSDNTLQVTSSESIKTHTDVYTATQNARLANYGKVVGGFKAWKPVLALTANGQGSLAAQIAAPVATNVLFGALGVLKGVSGFTKAFGPWGWIVSGVIDTIITAVTIYHYYIEATKIDLTWQIILGNNGYVFENVESGYGVSESALDSAVGDNRKEFTGTDHCPKIKTFDSITKGDDILKYPSGKDYDYYDVIRYDAQNEDVLQGIYSDPISPSIGYTTESKTLAVYSTTKSINTISDETNGDYITIKSIHSANETLEFRMGEAKDFGSLYLPNNYTGIEKPTKETWTDAWNGDGKLAISQPAELTPTGMGTKENPYVFNFTDATLWENLAYTLGEARNEFGDYKFRGTNVIVNIEIENGSNIYVGNKLIAEFNGTMNVINSKFIGLEYTLLTSDSKGIIKKSHSAVINGFKYEGDTNVVFDKDITLEGRANIGILFGEVCSGGSGVTINESELDINSFFISNDAMDNIANIGGFVAKASDNVKIANSIVSINTLSAHSNISAYNETDDIYSFGGFVGSVSAGTTSIEGSSSFTSTGSLKLVSDVNSAGAYVGYNGETLTISNPVVLLNNFNVVSTGNTKVGGVLGNNNGTATISGIVNISHSAEQGMKISSDVVKASYTPYVGGVVGYNGQTLTLSSSICINGNNNNNKKYEGAGYILAGANITDEFAIVPSQAYANVVVGYGFNQTTENASIIYKTVCIPNNSNINFEFESNTNNPTSIDGFIVNGSNISVNSGKTTDLNHIINSNDYKVEKRAYASGDKEVVEYKVTFITKTDYSETSIDDMTSTNLTGEVIKEAKLDIETSYKIKIFKNNTKLDDEKKFNIYVYLTKAYVVSYEKLDSKPETNYYRYHNNYTYFVPLTDASDKVVDENNPILIYKGIFTLGLSNEITIPDFATMDLNFSMTSASLTESDVDNSSNYNHIERTLSSTSTSFVVTPTGIQLKEILTLETTTTEYNIDELKNKYGADFTDIEKISEADLEACITESAPVINTYKRTLFSCDLDVEDTIYTSNSVMDSNPSYTIDDNGTNIGATTFSNAAGAMYNGYEIPNMSRGEYRGKEVITINNYKTESTQIISIITNGELDSDGNATYDIFELVYSVSGGKVALKGEISYSLTAEAYNLMLMNSESYSFEKRYPSYFPYCEEGIYNFKSSIKDNISTDEYKDSIEIEGLTFSIYDASLTLTTNEENVTTTELTYTNGKSFTGINITALGITKTETELQNLTYSYSLDANMSIVKIEKGNISVDTGDLTDVTYYTYNGEIVAYVSRGQYYYYNNNTSFTTNNLNFYKIVE